MSVRWCLLLPGFVTGCLSHASQLAVIDDLPHVGARVRGLGAVHERACATYLGLFPIPVWWVRTDQDALGFQFDTLEAAKRQSISQALARHPEADVLIYPRWAEQRSSAPPWYVETCVTLRAHLGRLEPEVTPADAPADAASSAAPAHAAPNLTAHQKLDTLPAEAPASPAQVEARLRGVDHLITSCQKRYAPQLGSLRVRLRIDASGNVDRVRVLDASGDLEACVGRVVRSVLFEPDSGTSYEHMVEFGQR